VRKGKPADAWIDATVRGLRVGEIGVSIAGRRALIASAQSKALVELPPTHGTIREERTITLAESGRADVVEVTRATGSLAVGRRWGFEGPDAKQRIDGVQKWVREAWDVPKGEPIDVKLGDDLANMTIHARAGIGWTFINEAVAWVASGTLFEELPAPLRTRIDKNDENGENGKSHTPRATPVRAASTFDASVIAVVKPPPGFRAAPLPPPVEWKLGPVEFKQSMQALPRGDVEVRTTLRQSALVVTAVDAQLIRERVSTFLSGEAPAVRFVSDARALREAGEARAAVRAALQGAPPPSAP
jgi:hypothetical protein